MNIKHDLQYFETCLNYDNLKKFAFPYNTRDVDRGVRPWFHIAGSQLQFHGGLSV
jgi:hypothetical protein